MFCLKKNQNKQNNYLKLLIKNFIRNKQNVKTILFPKIEVESNYEKEINLFLIPEFKKYEKDFEKELKIISVSFISGSSIKNENKNYIQLTPPVLILRKTK